MVLLYGSEYFTTLGYFLAELSKSIRILRMNLTTSDDISKCDIVTSCKKLNSCFLQQLVTFQLQAKSTKNLVFGSSSNEWVFYNYCTTFLPCEISPWNFTIYCSKLQLKLPDLTKNHDPWHLSPFRGYFESTNPKSTQQT